MADQEQRARRRPAPGRARAPRTTRSIAATSPPRSCAISGRMAGWLRADDLAEFQAQRRTAVPHAVRRLRRLWLRRLVAGADGAGGAEHPGTAGSLGMGHNSPAYIHAVTEALKLAAADREAYFGDPDFVDVPLDVLLSKDYAARAARADRSGARLAGACRRPGAIGGVTPPPWRPDPSAGSGARAGGGEAGHVVPVRRRSRWETCSPPRRATARSAGRWCRAPASWPRCGVRAAIPGDDHPGASVPGAGRACRPIRRSRSSRGGW